MKKARVSACLSLGLALWMVSPEGAAAESPVVEEYWGVATDENGGVVYREKHTTFHENGRIQRSITNYLDPEGREIAMMDSDYARSLAMPTYVFKDYRRDYEEGLRYRDGRYYIFHRDAGEGEKEKPLEDTSNVYSCQGWHYYVLQHMEELERDESFTLRLVFPNKLKAYPFKIERVGGSDEVMEVKVRFDNWVIRWLAPQLDLVYDKRDRRLLEFEGVSNILDADGDLQKVRITYEEDGAGRAPSP